MSEVLCGFQQCRLKMGAIEQEVPKTLWPVHSEGGGRWDIRVKKRTVFGIVFDEKTTFKC